MDTNRAARLARQIMNEHGLGQWTFQFDNAKRRFGYCSYSKRTISLSQHLVKLNDEALVRDTILHEVAHALVGSEAGHGIGWRAKCIEIGANPSRCFDAEEVETPQARYVGECPNGHRSYRHRMSKYSRNGKASCSKCSKRFDPRYVIKWYDTVLHSYV